jgi:hypothetical protein
MSQCVQQHEQHSVDSATVHATAHAAAASFGISYESLRRVIRQLDDYPDRKQWKVELGSGWSVERVGDVLRMIRETEHPRSNHSHGFGGSGDEAPCSDSKTIALEDRCWEWTRVSGNIEEELQQDATHSRLWIRLPQAWWNDEFSTKGPPPLSSISLEFTSVTLNEAESRHHHQQQQQQKRKDDGDDDVSARSSSTSLRFTPPWRSSPSKIRAFLRGQKVPVHLRDSTQVLFLNIGEESRDATFSTVSRTQRREKLVAVCIRDEWFVDKEFHLSAAASGDEIVVQLSRTRG